jgi:hypothetical protein
MSSANPSRQRWNPSRPCTPVQNSNRLRPSSPSAVAQKEIALPVMGKASSKVQRNKKFSKYDSINKGCSCGFSCICSYGELKEEFTTEEIDGDFLSNSKPVEETTSTFTKTTTSVVVAPVVEPVTVEADAASSANSSTTEESGNCILTDDDSYVSDNEVSELILSGVFSPRVCRVNNRLHYRDYMNALVLPNIYEATLARQKRYLRRVCQLILYTGGDHSRGSDKAEMSRTLKAMNLLDNNLSWDDDFILQVRLALDPMIGHMDKEPDKTFNWFGLSKVTDTANDAVSSLEGLTEVVSGLPKKCENSLNEVIKTLIDKIGPNSPVVTGKVSVALDIKSYILPVVGICVGIAGAYYAAQSSSITVGLITALTSAVLVFYPDISKYVRPIIDSATRWFQHMFRKDTSVTMVPEVVEIDTPVESDAPISGHSFEFLRSLITPITALYMYWFTGTDPHMSTLENFVQRSNFLRKFDEGVKFSLEHILNLFTTCSDFVARMFNWELPEALHPFPEVRPFELYVRDTLARLARYDLYHTRELAMAVESRFDAFNVMVGSLDNKTAQWRHAQGVLNGFKELKKSLEHVYVPTGVRPYPPTYVFVGGTQRGKTKLANYLVEYVTPQIVHDDMLDAVMLDPEVATYRVNPANNFLDGYHRPVTMVFDDVFMFKDGGNGANGVDQALAHLTRISNETPVQIDQAKAEDKGNAHATSKWQLATTNVMWWNENALKSFSWPDALIRRMNPWCPAVKLAYALPSDKPLQPHERLLDYTKLNPDDMDYDLWEIYPWDLTKGTYTGGPPVSAKQLGDIIVEDIARQARKHAVTLRANLEVRQEALRARQARLNPPPVVPPEPVELPMPLVEDDVELAPPDEPEAPPRPGILRWFRGQMDTSSLVEPLEADYWIDFDPRCFMDDIRRFRPYADEPLSEANSIIGPESESESIDDLDSLEESDSDEDPDHEERLVQELEPHNFEEDDLRVLWPWQRVRPFVPQAELPKKWYNRIWSTKIKAHPVGVVIAEAAKRVPFSEKVLDYALDQVIEPGPRLWERVTKVVKAIADTLVIQAATKFDEIWNWVKEHPLTTISTIVIAIGGLVGLVMALQKAFSGDVEIQGDYDELARQQHNAQLRKNQRLRKKLLKPLEPQMDRVFTSNDEALMTKLSGNMWFIGSEGTNHFGTLVVITQRYALINRHSFEYIKKSKLDVLVTPVVRDHIKYKFSSADFTSRVIHEFVPQAARVDRRNITIPEGTMEDYLIIEIPPGMPNGKTILQHFWSKHSEESRSDVLRVPGIIMFHNTCRRARELIIKTQLTKHTIPTLVGEVSEDKYVVSESLTYGAGLEGDCGSAVFVLTPSGMKIGGLHAYGNGTIGGARVFYREDLESILGEGKPLTIKAHGLLPLTKSDMELALTKTANYLPVARVNPVTSSGSTEAVHSRYYGILGELKHRPAKLHNFMLDGKEVNVMWKATSHYGKGGYLIPDKLFTAVTDVLIADTINRNNHITRPYYTVEEVTFGIPGHLKGISRSTSAGVYESRLAPVGTNPKKWFLGSGDERGGPGWKVLVDEIEDTRARVLRGEEVIVILGDNLKDEVVSEKKSREGNTRLFSNGSLVFLILCKQYFQCYVSMVTEPESRIRNRHSSGINPITDWKVLAELIMTKMNKLFMDYKKFDASLFADLMRYAFRAMRRVIPDRNSDDAIMRDWIETMIINSYHVNGSFLYQCLGSNPSGNFLTLMINDLCNHILQLTAAYIFYSNGCSSIDEDTGRPIIIADYDMEIDPVEIAKVLRCMFIVTMGDDVIASFDGILDDYTTADVANILEQFGITITNGDKTDAKTVPLSYCALEDLTFLKRGFRRHGRDWVAPLEWESILKSLYWTTMGANPADFSILIQNMLYEIALHGRLVFDRHVPILLNAVRVNSDLHNYPCVTDFEACLMAGRQYKVWDIVEEL